ncbi:MULTISPECIES: flavodoxin family protein [Thalassotalea]|uniref:flavodoxin family protein n=1 Tax=Thalassotalea TaxID=1518149 RepID=UPI000943302A|nr:MULTISPECIES: flavodoxin family protein [Thalassotalea]OKY25094.1 hypothetical protein BI291_03505 [Thalassotalea sp. PP2-459]
MKAVIIVATSRDNGNTVKCANALALSFPADIINLSHYQFSYYDYQNKNKDDDFLKLAEQICQYDLIIYASPIYWYAMSAQMKVFFDRLTDLVTIEKLLGRALKNKRNALISTGAEKVAPSCFVEPFALTADYFDMRFIGNYYLPVIQQEISEQHFEQYIVETTQALKQY